MKKAEAILMYQVLMPIPVTKFSDEIQTALLGNYLMLHAIAKAHDETYDTAKKKIVSEGITDEKEQKRKVGSVMTAFGNEDAGVNIKKIDRKQFLAEAKKADVGITLAQIGILEPMFNA